MLHRLKWLGEFAIDTVPSRCLSFLAAVFQLGDRIGDSHPQISFSAPVFAL